MKVTEPLRIMENIRKKDATEEQTSINRDFVLP